MGSEDFEILDDDEKSFSSINCSICLDAVTDNKGRSFAKLQCGHQFHLDCIGSAFNIKGAMQCPNCRKVEKGQWLFANGCCSLPEINFEDWIRDDELYDLSYSEMAFGVHWCPFSGLTRLPSSLDEGEFPSSAYHDLLGQHAIFAEHTPVSSGPHPCPYVAYLGPIHPTSSNSSRNAVESSSFISPWNGPSVPAQIPLSYGFPAIDPQYHNWEHHSVPFSNASNRIVNGGGGGSTDQPSAMHGSQRSGRINQEIPRSGSIMRPFPFGHGAGARAGNSSSSPMIPPYPGSNARAHDRVQALQAYSQQLQPSNSPAFRTPVIPTSRRAGHRGVAQVSPVASSYDQTSDVYFFQSGTSSRNFPQNPQPLRFHPWEREHSSFPVNRDPIWGSLHQPVGGGSNSGSRPSNYHRERNGSDRTSSQNW